MKITVAIFSLFLACKGFAQHDGGEHGGNERHERREHEARERESAKEARGGKETKSAPEHGGPHETRQPATQKMDKGGGGAEMEVAPTGMRPFSGNPQHGGRPVDANGAKLGPSGKPMNYNKDFNNRSQAMEAARDAGSRPPIEHEDHFHAVDSKGNKIPGEHFSNPKSISNPQLQVAPANTSGFGASGASPQTKSPARFGAGNPPATSSGGPTFGASSTPDNSKKITPFGAGAPPRSSGGPGFGSSGRADSSRKRSL
jgi:hypothetical protein